jgi:hypothetical protein
MMSVRFDPTEVETPAAHPLFLLMFSVGSRNSILEIYGFFEKLQVKHNQLNSTLCYSMLV